MSMRSRMAWDSLCGRLCMRFATYLGKQGYLADAKGLSSPEELKDEYLALANEPGELIDDEATDLLTKWLAGGLLEDYLPGERQALKRYVITLHEMGLLANGKAPQNVQHQERHPGSPSSVRQSPEHFLDGPAE